MVYDGNPEQTNVQQKATRTMTWDLHWVPAVTDQPVVTGLTPQFPGVFLGGESVPNRFDVAVNWNGNPGSVEFSIDGNVIATEPGTAAGASHVFDMGTDFGVSVNPIHLGITAINAEGKRSALRVFDQCVEPNPAWINSTTVISNGSVEYTLKGETPHIGPSTDYGSGRRTFFWR